jgi:hypothetical protein
MKSYSTKWFNKWAKKNRISIDSLLDGIERTKIMIGSADLGGSLYKVRIAKEGQGRSGGYRTIVVVKEAKRSLYLYGFEKSDMDNIDDKQLKDLKRVAQVFLDMSIEKINELVNTNELVPLEKK